MSRFLCARKAHQTSWSMSSRPCSVPMPKCPFWLLSLDGHRRVKAPVKAWPGGTPPRAQGKVNNTPTTPTRSIAQRKLRLRLIAVPEHTTVPGDCGRDTQETCLDIHRYALAIFRHSKDPSGHGGKIIAMLRKAATRNLCPRLLLCRSPRRLLGTAGTKTSGGEKSIGVTDASVARASQPPLGNPAVGSMPTIATSGAVWSMPRAAARAGGQRPPDPA